MTKDHYVFPAIFDYTDKENGIAILFPDLLGCLPCADTTEEAIKNAKEAMALHLVGMEMDDEEIPEPTAIEEIKLEKGQTVVLVDVWMPLYRDKVKYASVKKTLTIPRWLNDAAEQNKVNFSLILQQGLKEYLGIQEHK